MELFLKDLIWHKNVCWVQWHSSGINTQSAQCGVWLCVMDPKDTLPLGLESNFARSNLSLSPAIRIPSGLCYFKWPLFSLPSFSQKKVHFLLQPWNLSLLQ